MTENPYKRQDLILILILLVNTLDSWRSIYQRVDRTVTKYVQFNTLIYMWCEQKPFQLHKFTFEIWLQSDVIFVHPCCSSKYDPKALEKRIHCDTRGQFCRKACMMLMTNWTYLHQCNRSHVYDRPCATLVASLSISMHNLIWFEYCNLIGWSAWIKFWLYWITWVGIVTSPTCSTANDKFK